MLKLLSGEVAPCALLLGGFDGLHIGHSVLLKAAKETGLPVGATLLTGNKAGGNVFTFEEREGIFSRAGASFVLELPFTEELKNTSAQDFLKNLFSQVEAKAVFCGEDFRFGRHALGTPELVKELAPCPVRVLPLQTENGKKIATSQIKELLAIGDIRGANRLLLEPYFIRGRVEHGRKTGRTYGFPTINLTYPAEKFPIKEGVYGGSTRTPFGTFPALIHFGECPTFGVTYKKVEAYLKGFEGDLYDKTVEICPARYLRPVQKFAGREALEAQLERDMAYLQEEEA